jgi:hypothetical protein
MADPTLYLFDGYNLLHAGSFTDARELTDALASFVAMRGARGVVVWDGAGSDTQIGPLTVLHAPQADAVLERLAAEHRGTEEVCLVSSDFAIRGTSGQEVQKRSSRSFPFLTGSVHCKVLVTCGYCCYLLPQPKGES